MPDDHGIFAPRHPLWTQRYSKTQIHVFRFGRGGVVHANVACALLSDGQIVVGEVKEPHANGARGNWVLPPISKKRERSLIIGYPFASQDLWL